MLLLFLSLARHEAIQGFHSFLFITEKKQKVLLWFVHFAFCYRLIFGNSKNSASPQTVPNFFKNLVDRITKFTKKRSKNRADPSFVRMTGTIYGYTIMVSFFSVLLVLFFYLSSGIAVYLMPVSEH